MLNTFPSLLFLGVLSTTLIRVVSGILFTRFGWLKLTQDKESKINFFKKIGLRPAVFFLWLVASTELIIGIMITTGLLIQISAIIASLIMLASIVIKIMKPKTLPNTLDFYILFFVVFVSLIFSGAGLFAINLSL